MIDEKFEVVFNGINYNLKNNENSEEMRLADEKVCYDYICDLLNELHEENQQLKKALKELKEIGIIKQIEYMELQDENEQVKKVLLKYYNQELGLFTHDNYNSNKTFTAIGKEVWQDGEVWCVAGGKHCADVIATALNNLHEENDELRIYFEHYKNKTKELQDKINAYNSKGKVI